MNIQIRRNSLNTKGTQIEHYSYVSACRIFGFTQGMSLLRSSGNLLAPYILPTTNPAWVMLSSSSMPIVIKTSDLGNNNTVQA